MRQPLRGAVRQAPGWLAGRGGGARRADRVSPVPLGRSAGGAPFAKEWPVRPRAWGVALWRRLAPVSIPCAPRPERCTVVPELVAPTFPRPAHPERAGLLRPWGVLNLRDPRTVGRPRAPRACQTPALRQNRWIWRLPLLFRPSIPQSQSALRRA